MPNLTTEQIEERRSLIGGSDAAAILGCNRFQSAYDIFLQKTGQAPEKVATEEMGAGHWFEDAIAGWYAKRTGREVWVDDETYRHPEYRYLGCHVDRFQNCSYPWASKGAVEIKLTSKATVYESYELQLQHILLVTGCQWGTVVVQGGSKQIHKDFEADKDLHASMLVIYEKFWKAVEAKDWALFTGGA